MDIYKKRTLKKIYIFDNYKFILKFEDGTSTNFKIDNFGFSIDNKIYDFNDLHFHKNNDFYQKNIDYISKVEIFPKKIENFEYIHNKFKKFGKQVNFSQLNSFVFILHAHSKNESFIISIIFFKNEFFIIPIFNKKENNNVEDIKTIKPYNDFLTLSQNSKNDTFLKLIQSLNYIDKSTILEFIF